MDKHTNKFVFAAGIFGAFFGNGYPNMFIAIFGAILIAVFIVHSANRVAQRTGGGIAVFLITFSLQVILVGWILGPIAEIIISSIVTLLTTFIMIGLSGEGKNATVRPYPKN